MKWPLALSKAYKGLYPLHMHERKPNTCIPTHEQPLSNELHKSSTTCFQSSCSSVPNNSVFVNHPNAVLWHNRLGHLPFYKIKQLSMLNVAENFSFPYNVCPQAREHRLPFSHSQIHTSIAFELIDIDIWGPYHTFNT